MARVAEFAAEDLARAWQLPEGARTRARYEFLAGLLAASGITDALPGMTCGPGSRGVDIFVRSAARGRVRIGSWDEAAVTAAERGFLLAARAELAASVPAIDQTAPRRGPQPAAGASEAGPSAVDAQPIPARLVEAEAATPEPRTDQAVATHFRGLNADGSVGMEPESLARLRRRAAHGNMPE